MSGACSTVRQPSAGNPNLPTRRTAPKPRERNRCDYPPVGQWTVDPLPLVGGAVALVLYAQGFQRLRSRGKQHVGWGRAAIYTLGVVVGVLALVSPIDTIGEEKLLAVHMLQHLLLGDVAPLFIVLGLMGPMSVFLLPADVLRSVGRFRPLRALISFLLRPWVSFWAWVIAMAAWHIPTAYDAAVRHPAVHVAEHWSFVATGLLVWIQILDPSRHRRLSQGMRAVYAGLLLFAGMVLGEVLIAAHPLYAPYFEVPNRPFGWDAAEDQNRAGVLMMAEQVLTFGMVALLLVWGHVEQVEREHFSQPQPPTEKT
ncbi:MAG: hypothetical protein F2663_07095 [Actinobacteria bacterium]|nr:hypothetical protein [Actinomycetota bacterium]